MEGKIQFADERTMKAFEKLSTGKYEEKELMRYLERAFSDIEEDPFCGIQIPKKLIPMEYYQRHNIKNLWKYNLPNAWRLLYSLEGQKIVVLAVILEWLDHKEYERRFKY